MGVRLVHLFPKLRELFFQYGRRAGFCFFRKNHTDDLEDIGHSSVVKALSTKSYVGVIDSGKD